MATKQEAMEAWVEYIKAVIKAFNFHQDSGAEIPQILLEVTTSPTEYDKFIIYCKDKTSDLQS